MNQQPYKATPEDGSEILRILESSAAKGAIELIYTRRPDAYRSYMMEPGEARVFVSKEDDRIIGTSAQLIRPVYIGGEVSKAAYLCGLKKDASYDGSVGFGADFIRTLRRDDIDFYYCSVVEENERVKRMFEKKRRILAMKPLTTYTTYIVSPRVKIKAPKHSLTFRQATEADVPRLMAFLHEEGRKMDLFPVITRPDEWQGLSCKDFYMLLDGDRLLAAAALWNQTAYKQYIVKRYGKAMKCARLLNPVLSALGYIRLPKENEPLDFPILSLFVCLDQNETYYRIFLKEIKAVIAESYGMFVIGLPEHHFAKSIFDPLPSIHFQTRLYEVTFPWSGQATRAADPQKIYPDCGLL